MSVLTKDQKRVFVTEYTEAGTSYRITVEMRHDDQCGNGHNSFSITGDIYRKAKNGRWVHASGGCIHDEIARHFPHLTPFIKWHLCSTDGPMHYVANTIYWVERGRPEWARNSAVWPEATTDNLEPMHLTADGMVLDKAELKRRLEVRLPGLLDEFRAAVEALGLVY